MFSLRDERVYASSLSNASLALRLPMYLFIILDIM